MNHRGSKNTCTSAALLLYCSVTTFDYECQGQMLCLYNFWFQMKKWKAQIFIRIKLLRPRFWLWTQPWVRYCVTCSNPEVIQGSTVSQMYISESQFLLTASCLPGSTVCVSSTLLSASLCWLCLLLQQAGGDEPKAWMLPALPSSVHARLLLGWD